MTTAPRLLSMLSLLQTHRSWPGALLASRLGVSGRTVRRDVDRLRDMGYRIHATMGPAGGYRLDSGSELPPVLFDDDQALAVAIALRTAPAIGAGIEDAAMRALGTIRQVMPSRLRHRLDALEVTTVGRPGDAAPVDVSLDVLVTLAKAIRDRETVHVDYPPRDVAAGADTTQDRLPTCRVELHHLVASQGRWYLVGWDLDRGDWRLYRVDRIHPRPPNGPRFTPRTVPGGDVDEFVSARFKGSDVNAWACRGTVVLHLPASKVRPFAGDATVTAIDEHSCTLEVGSWSWPALAAWLGRFDAAMEVLGPPELAAAFALLARRFATIGRGPAGDQRAGLDPQPPHVEDQPPAIVTGERV